MGRTNDELSSCFSRALVGLGLRTSSRFQRSGRPSRKTSSFPYLGGVLAQGTSCRKIMTGSNTTYVALTHALIPRVPPEDRKGALKLMSTITSQWLGRVVEACVAHGKAS